MEDCKTRYPIMLVHGTGSRDFKRIRYWGRIPQILREHGAAVYFGGQDGWGTIEENARQIKASMEQILKETGCGKLHLIAHSKGGLDARYLVSSLGMAGHVSSLTTISTPHRGSKTIDWLCGMPAVLFRFAALFVNFWYRRLGDKQPDFYAVSRSFSTQAMKEFNTRNPDAPGVLYQSYAGDMPHCRADLMMLIPFLVIRRFDGANDGLVSVESAKWGDFRGVLLSAGKRGISHMDEIDIRRRPLLRPKGTSKGDGIRDIPDVYVGIVQELKNSGL